MGSGVYASVFLLTLGVAGTEIAVNRPLQSRFRKTLTVEGESGNNMLRFACGKRGEPRLARSLCEQNNPFVCRGRRIAKVGTARRP